MIRIIDERGTGKTSQLMLWAKEYDATFICANPKAMKYKAKIYGIEGIEFMIDNASGVPFNFYFTASSCVAR